MVSKTKQRLRLLVKLQAIIALCTGKIGFKVPLCKACNLLLIILSM